MRQTNSDQPTLVIGAGELGISVLRNLAAVAPPGTLAVLLRPLSSSPPDQPKQATLDELRTLGVSIIEGDLAHLSASALAEILKPYGTVISCTGFVGGSGTQLKIAQAALFAKVKRYVPWQFGVDYDVIGRGSAQDLFDEQLDVRDLLRSQAQTEWLIISTGMFTSFLFDPDFNVFNLEQGEVHALGSWANSVTITTAGDIGRLTVEVLLAQPRISNQVVFVGGDTVTYEHAADLVDEILGIKLRREVWSVPELQARHISKPEDALAKYHVVFAEGRGVSWPMSTTFNVLRGLPVTGLSKWLRAKETT